MYVNILDNVVLTTLKRRCTSFDMFLSILVQPTRESCSNVIYVGSFWLPKADFSGGFLRRRSTRGEARRRACAMPTPLRLSAVRESVIAQQPSATSTAASRKRAGWLYFPAERVKRLGHVAANAPPCVGLFRKGKGGRLRRLCQTTAFFYARHWKGAHARKKSRPF